MNRLQVMFSLRRANLAANAVCQIIQAGSLSGYRQACVPPVVLRSTGSFCGSPYYGQLLVHFGGLRWRWDGMGAFRGIRVPVEREFKDKSLRKRRQVGAKAVVTKW
jgi:hypothetical protein